MAKLVRSLPVFTLRPNLKPLSVIPITTTTLIPFSLTSLEFSFHSSSSSSSISKLTHCNTSVHALSALHAAEQQHIRVPDPFESAKESDLEWVSRTALCGHLGEGDVGKRVTLCGWVALHRVHGGLTFVNLRDYTGIVQITTLPNDFPDAHSVVNDVRLEYVLAVEGVVRLRPSESVNKKMETGMVEVTVESVKVLNSARSNCPFW